MYVYMYVYICMSISIYIFVYIHIYIAQRLDRPQVLAYTCDAAIDSTTLYAYPASPSGTRLHIRPCDTSVTI